MSWTRDDSDAVTPYTLMGCRVKTCVQKTCVRMSVVVYPLKRLIYNSGYDEDFMFNLNLDICMQLK